MPNHSFVTVYSSIDEAMDIIDKVDKVYCNCKDVIQKEITIDEISVLKSIIHKINDNVEKELNS